MKIKVLYQSKGGNTMKIADAIAQAVGETSEAIPPAYPPENVGLLFLGGGVYFGKVDKKMKEFIGTLNTNRVRNVAVFGTCGGEDKGVKMMQELLKAQGINVVEEYFLCKAKSLIFFHRGHPDERDLQAAREFAGEVMKKFERQ